MPNAIYLGGYKIEEDERVVDGMLVGNKEITILFGNHNTVERFKQLVQKRAVEDMKVEGCK
jgi:hypothetical protein